MKRANRLLRFLLYWIALLPNPICAQELAEVETPRGELAEGVGTTQRIQILETRIYGASTIPIEVLRRVGRVRNGDYVDTIKPAQVVQRIRKKYQEFGFDSVRIEFRLTPSSSAYWNIAEIHIEEGYQSKIREVGVDGVFPEDIASIPERLEIDATGTPASKANIEQLRKNLLLALRREGYLQATVSAPEKRLLPDSPDYILNFRIEPKDPLTIVFVGNDAVTPDELLAPLRMESRTVPFTPGAISSLTREIGELYRQRGYFAVEVGWQEMPRQGTRKIFQISIIEGPQYRCALVLFSGNQLFSDSLLSEKVSVQRSGWGVFRRWSRGIVQPSQLEVDVETIREMYADAGYFDSTVEAVVTKDEAAETLAVEFRIVEGPQRVVEEVELVWEGLTESLDSDRVGELLVIESQIVTGEPFSRGKLRDEQRRLYELLQTMGFPNAAVEMQGDAVTGTVRYQITPGRPVKIGEISISGLVFTKEFVIQREVPFHSGEPWNDDQIRRTQQRLAELGLFREVQIVPRDGALDSSVENLELRFKERPSGRSELGAAFTTEDGLHVFGELGQRNFLGRAHRIRLIADGYFKAENSVADAGRLRLGYAVPRVLETPYEFLSELFVQSNTQLVDEYSYDRFGAWFSLHRQVSEHLRLIAGISGYKDALFDVDPEVIIDPRDSDSTVYLFPGVGIEFDFRDSRLAPSNGYRSFFDLRGTSEEIGADVSMLYGMWQQSYLQRLGSKFIWANKLQMEAWEPFGSTDVVPLSQRLFLGGQNSLRGFSKNSIAPRGSEGVPVGGDRSLSASSELRYAFSDSFTGLVFLDFGQTFLVHEGSFDGENNSINDLRYSPGFGVHYNTPIGPIRSELGFALDREFGERWGRLNISIGTGY